MQKKSNLKSLGTFENVAREKFKTIQGGLHNGVKYTKNAARSVDRYSHRNPWMVVGLVSVFAGVLGFLFGMRKGHSKK